MYPMRVLAGLTLLASAALAQSGKSVTPKCQDAVGSATSHYDDWKGREVTDVSNFKRATSLYEKALKECRGTELESAAWISLANASFLAQEWAKAASAICKSSAPLHQNLCSTFKECRRDQDFETLRRASLHELHGNLRGARELYRKVSETKCQGLAAHGKAEVDRVGKLLETSQPPKGAVLFTPYSLAQLCENGKISFV